MSDSPQPTPPRQDDEPIEAELVPDPPAPAPAPAPPPPAPELDYDEHGVPTFDYVRNKIEGRVATSIGATELAEESIEGRTLEQQAAEREKAAKAKLDEIRKSLRN